MSGNSQTFVADLKKFGVTTLDRHNRFRKGVAIKLFGSIIKDTPVLTGRLRANWRCSLGAPDTTTSGDTDSNGSVTITAMTVKVASATEDVAIVLANSLPYAHRIEYDGWSHTKAPAGMVRKNVARIHNILKEALTETR